MSRKGLLGVHRALGCAIGLGLLSLAASAARAQQDGGKVTGWEDRILYPVARGENRFTQISAGSGHNLALRPDGTVVAWGGRVALDSSVYTSLTGVVKISGGHGHSLALKADGTVVGWSPGKIGWAPPPSDLGVVTDIAAGGNHCLALKADGTIRVWGTLNGGVSPAPPAELKGIVTLGAGLYHSLAVKADGAIVAWGQNDFGELDVPSGLNGVIAVDGGAYFSVALRGDGTVVAWGRNQAGQCDVPAGLSEVIAISVGELHSLALRRDGTVVAWGWNPHGERDVPADLRDVVAISAGSMHSLALKSDGTLVTWGDYLGGVRAVPDGMTGVAAFSLDWGTGGTGAVLTPDGRILDLWSQKPLGPDGLSDVAAIAPNGFALKRDGTLVAWAGDVPDALSGVTAIAAGGGHRLALKRDGTIVAWGHHEWGQTDVPPELREVVAISGGGGHTLALTAEGRVVAWGWNQSPEGQWLGQATVPSGLSGVVAISAGTFHSLALTAGGTVVAWGGNDRGQCAVPYGLSGVIAISAGLYRNLALQQDGTVVAWGQAEDPHLFIPRGTPVSRILAGDGDSLALLGGVNHPPVAPSYSLSTERNTRASVSLFELHQACSDPDWDSFIIPAVSETSAAGGAAQINGRLIFYTPPFNLVGSDSFTYSVRDSRGGIAQGTVQVTIMDSTSSGAPIPTLFNTGVDGAGTVQTDGTIGDPHYTLTTFPGGTSTLRIRRSGGGWPIEPGWYIGDDVQSAWIGPNNGNFLEGPPGRYVYRTTFNLCGFDPATALIVGQWSKDDFGSDILLNGVSIATGVSPDPYFYAWAPFAIDGGFVAGVNTLDFVIDNQGGPTAVRVEMSGTAQRLSEASRYQLGTGRNEGAHLAISKLRRACGIADEDATATVEVSSTSAAGGEVRVDGNSVLYTPPVDFVGSDTFTYTVRSDRNGIVYGTVEVSVSGPVGSGPSVLGVRVQPDGTATVRCAGVPGEPYFLEASTDLTHWVVLGLSTAEPNGLFQFTDTEASHQTARYYRTRHGTAAAP